MAAFQHPKSPRFGKRAYSISGVHWVRLPGYTQANHEKYPVSTTLASRLCTGLSGLGLDRPVMLQPAKARPCERRFLP